LEAITAYEIFLRYYVLGLKFALSPYAFHTIGSTITCTADAYVAVEGMNRRKAAEDFYFLQKLAKYRGIGKIKETSIYPSARVSGRVPFGTGRKMYELSAAGRCEIAFYHPLIFLVLKDFLCLINGLNSPLSTSGRHSLSKCRSIDPGLADFLEKSGFIKVWEKLKQNSKERTGLLRHFNNWFDSLRTLKLIHYLRDNRFESREMFSAVEGLFRLAGEKGHKIDGKGLKKGRALLEFMRSTE